MAAPPCEGTGVELRDLRTFLQTIDSGTITAASGELHLVQSAVSRAIKRLEDEFGLTLLERMPDGVTPTPAGADFARHAEVILAAVAAAESDMAAHRDSASGRVRVGFLTSVVPLLLAPLLRRLRARHPHIRAEFAEGLPLDLLARIRERRLDVALTWFPLDTGDLESAALVKLPLALIVAPDHRLAADPRVELTDLGQEAWVSFRSGGPSHTWIARAGAAGGFSPRIVTESETFAELKAFVQAGAGITLLPAAVVRPESGSDALRALPLDGSVPAATLGAVWLDRRRAPLVEAVIEAVGDLARAGGLDAS